MIFRLLSVPGKKTLKLWMCYCAECAHTSKWKQTRRYIEDKARLKTWLKSLDCSMLPIVCALGTWMCVFNSLLFSLSRENKHLTDFNICVKTGMTRKMGIFFLLLLSNAIIHNHIALNNFNLWTWTSTHWLTSLHFDCCVCFFSPLYFHNFQLIYRLNNLKSRNTHVIIASPVQIEVPV